MLSADASPNHLNSDPAPTLFYFLQIIVHRWRLITALTVAVSVGTAIYALNLPNVYTARAKILPPQQQSGLLSAAMMQGALAAIGGGDILGESKSVRLYVEMLKVESLRDPVIERLKLQQVYQTSSREAVYQLLSNNVTVLAGKEGIITISVEDRDPKLAAELANALVEELKKFTTRMSMVGAVNNKGFLEERIVKAREELIQAEDSLKAFQSRYKTLDASQQATLSASAAAQLSAQLTGSEIQLGILRRTYADSSQTVKALEKSLDVLTEPIGRMPGREGSLALPGFEQIPERGQEYLHLMRRFKTAEAVNEMLAKQYEMAKLNAENDVSSIQVIQKALVPEKKSRPARGQMLKTATCLGFLGSLLLALVLEKIAKMPEEGKARWKNLLKKS